MSEREFNYKAWADVDPDKKIKVEEDVDLVFPYYLAAFANRMREQ